MVAWGAILKGVVSIAPSVIGLFKKKKDAKTGEVPETVAKKDATTKQSLMDILAGALSGAASGSAGGGVTGILGALAGGLTSLFKQKKDGVKTNFMDSLLGNVGTNGIIGLLSTLVSLFKGKKEDKGGAESVDNVSDARNVLANARNGQNNVLADRVARLEAQMAGPQPQFGGFNVGAFPPVAAPFARPVRFATPPIAARPVFRGPQPLPFNHPVNRVMPNNFGRMV